MNYSEFLGQVQNRARLGTQEEAVRATRATLQTLGQRLAGGEPNNIAAQLPNEIGRYLKISGASEGVRFGLDEFFERVRAHMGEGTDLPDAVYHARVVMSVLKEALSPGEWRDMKAQLPDEYDALLESGWTGEMDDADDTGDTNVIDEGDSAQRNRDQQREQDRNRRR
jgi:uncharacterized protein (DUF2267 family)